jgi:hypothetical protein
MLLGLVDTLPDDVTGHQTVDHPSTNAIPSLMSYDSAAEHTGILEL